MLRVILVIILMFVCASPYFAQQTKDSYALDSVQIYTPGKQEYFFLINGGTQGLYIENYDLKNADRLLICVINNTPDTLISNYKVRDGGVVWFVLSSLPYGKKVNPGDTIRFYAGWQRQQVSFSSLLSFDYTVSGTPTKSNFRIWGNHKTEPEPVKETPKPVSATQKTYYPNGFIKTERDKVNEYHYSETVNGQITKHLFGDSARTSRIVFDYENGEIRSKTSTKRISYQTQKIPYTISKGTFLNQELQDGIIDFYNVNDELVVSVLVRNRIQQEGFLYKGKRYNLTDSLGQKEGKWIGFSGAGYCSHYSIADYGCRYVQKMETYKEGVLTDTVFSFYESGKVSFMCTLNKELTDRVNIYYREDGSISQTYRYLKDPGGKTVQLTTRYSDSGCIIEKTLDGQGKMEYKYTYANCKLMAKISKRTEQFYDTTQVMVPEHIEKPRFVGEGYIEEGFEKEILVKQERGFSSRLIPHTVETGEFDAEEVFLVNGIIQYYDEKHVLLKTRKVVNGIILETE